MKKLFLLISLALTFQFVFAIKEIGQELEQIIKISETELENGNLDNNTELNFSDVVSQLHSFEITKFDNEKDFMPMQSIRRDEVAKMMTLMIENALKKEIVKEIPEECKFTDLDKAHSDLPEIIQKSCALNIFKGYQGNFMPTKNITNAEAVTVIMRILDGYQDEKGSHRAENYFEKAKSFGDGTLLDGLDISQKSVWDFPATRETVAYLIYKAINLK